MNTPNTVEGNKFLLSFRIRTLSTFGESVEICFEWSSQLIHKNACNAKPTIPNVSGKLFWLSQLYRTTFEKCGARAKD